MRVISLDTETSGVDFRHGARPFFVTTCIDAGEVRYWEWGVDPLTRQPEIPEPDIDEIAELVSIEQPLVLQNAKFDALALSHVSPLFHDWPWHRTEDTLIAGHLLASALPHNLTDMVLQYLGEDIQHFEDAVEVATKAGRKMVQQARLRVKRAREKGAEPDGEDEALAEWQIAEAGRADMPSAQSSKAEGKDRVWKFDMWLPRALWLRYPAVREEHPEWETVLRDYANADSEHTMALWQVMLRELQKRGLEAIYRERMKVISVVHKMKQTGVTVNRKRLNELRDAYTIDSAAMGDRCVKIADCCGYDLSLPKSGNNGSLLKFCFEPEGLGLPTVVWTDKGNPSLDKDAFTIYGAILDPRTRQGKFIESLARKRKRDTTVQYMNSYERFMLGEGDWGVLYPDLNPTGTTTLRFSSSNPNGQNISKKPDPSGNSIKYIFGPPPGFEWWSFDYENIELRIPAYESGEKGLIDLFERSKEPPFYGSEHLLNFSIVYRDIWERLLKKHGQEGVGAEVKKLEEYGWCKNGDFAIGYGAGRATADRAFHRLGHDLLKSKFAKKEALNTKYVQMAKRLGYVETLPDKTVDPTRGYPIMCSRSQWGDISPTIPLNYHVQSTAMWCTMKAMIRCQAALDEWNRKEPDRYAIVLQVHDEIVFQLPARGAGNLDKVAVLRRLMEQSGDDIGVPLSVAAKYHPNNWCEDVKCLTPVNRSLSGLSKKNYAAS